MKIVLDANVVVAAFAARGLCESILELCFHSHEIVLCEDLLEEILKNLQHKINLPEGIVEDIGKLLRENTRMLSPIPLAADICRDPDDVQNYRTGNSRSCRLHCNWRQRPAHYGEVSRYSNPNSKIILQHAP